jgi:hypothetical protein
MIPQVMQMEERSRRRRGRRKEEGKECERK